MGNEGHRNHRHPPDVAPIDLPTRSPRSPTREAPPPRRGSRGSDLPETTSWAEPVVVPGVPLAVVQAVDARSAVAIAEVEAESSAEVRAAEIISDIEGQVVDAGTVLTVPSAVPFDVDQARPRPDARDSLDGIVEELGFYPEAPVQVTGHTTGPGSPRRGERIAAPRHQRHRAGPPAEPPGRGPGRGRHAPGRRLTRPRSRVTRLHALPMGVRRRGCPAAGGSPDAASMSKSQKWT